jgi:hypothetical protein
MIFNLKTQTYETTKRIIQRVIIFIGIGLYFMLMEILGLADLYYLRVFNVLFVFYGTNRTLKMNYKEGKTLFASNAVSLCLLL